MNDNQNYCEWYAENDAKFLNTLISSKWTKTVGDGGAVVYSPTTWPEPSWFESPVGKSILLLFVR